jgi:hypothetical protein
VRAHFALRRSTVNNPKISGISLFQLFGGHQVRSTVSSRLHLLYK